MHCVHYIGTAKEKYKKGKKFMLCQAAPRKQSLRITKYDQNTEKHLVKHQNTEKHYLVSHLF